MKRYRVNAIIDNLYISSQQNRDFIEGLSDHADRLRYMQRYIQKGLRALIPFAAAIMLLSLFTNSINTLELILFRIRPFLDGISCLVLIGYETRIIRHLREINGVLIKLEKGGTLVYGQIIWSKTYREVRPPRTITYFKYVFTVPDNIFKLQNTSYCILEHHNSSIPKPEIGTNVVVCYLNSKLYILL